VLLNFLLLPALLTLLRPAGEPQALGFRWAAPFDRFLLVRRRSVLFFALFLAALGLAALPYLHFDFDPIDLQNPRNEAVETLLDMMHDPATNPYAAEILAPSSAAAKGLAARLAQLPQVKQTLTVASFIPKRQKEKLATIADLAFLIGPTLSPPSVRAPPSPAEVRDAIAKSRDALRQLAAKEGAGSAPGRFARTLDGVLARGPKILPPLAAALTSGVQRELTLLRKLITAKPVTLKSLPEHLRRDWVTADGRARVEVSPRGDVRADRAVLRDFVHALRTIAPGATGPAVTIQEIGRMVTRAFAEAGATGIAAIALLLWIVLRRLRDVLLVIAPLALAAILTLATTVVIGMPLNYANIIALPLLLGIGVAFDIYFVLNWRGGVSNHLQSSTARAVIFSALTTMSAFGSLALSHDPGLSDIGQLLVVSLGYTLFSTLVILPSLLGRAPQPAGSPPSGIEGPSRGFPARS
jgi:hopanoid biosynthesis associated RND transporter like protein HpnN